MLGLLASEFVVQGVNRLLKELHLHLVLLLDVAVLDDHFLLVVFDVALELGEHAHFELLVVVDVLGNPVDGVFEGADVALVLANRLSCGLDGRLHVLLLEAQVLHDEAQVCIERVELFESLVFRVGLELELASFDLLGSDLLLQLLDTVIEHELELLKLLSLSLELVDLSLAITDLGILLSYLLLQRLHVVIEAFQCILLLLHCIVLIIDIPLETLHIGLDIVHLVLDQLQLGFRLKCHIMHLSLVFFVFVMDLLELFVAVLFDLIDGHLVPSDQLFIIFLLFVDLRLLVLHLLLVLLLLKQDLILVVLLNLLDRSQKVLMLSFLLSLQFGKLFSIVQHSATVLISFLLDFILLFVKQFSAFDLFGIFRFLNLA